MPIEVYWKWEVDDEHGEWGPVEVRTFAEDSGRLTDVEEWDRWATRSEAEEFAKANGYEFMADE